MQYFDRTLNVFGFSDVYYLFGPKPPIFYYFEYQEWQITPIPRKKKQQQQQQPTEKKMNLDLKTVLSVSS